MEKKTFDLILVLPFFFNDTPTPEIYTLSLHDALPISRSATSPWMAFMRSARPPAKVPPDRTDRKSTRLNSSHEWSAYAVCCWKKKNGGYAAVRRHVRSEQLHTDDGERERR